jgi:hypothetical protein
MGGHRGFSVQIGKSGNLGKTPGWFTRNTT